MSIYLVLKLSIYDAFCRICLLLMLTTALGGTWVLEQPAGSALEFYPTFRWLITQLISISGVKSVGSLVGKVLSHVNYLMPNYRCHLSLCMQIPLHVWPRFPELAGTWLGLELKLPNHNMRTPIHQQSGCWRTLKVPVYTRRSRKTIWRWRHVENTKTKMVKTAMLALHVSKERRFLNALYVERTQFAFGVWYIFLLFWNPKSYISAIQCIRYVPSRVLYSCHVCFPGSIRTPLASPSRRSSMTSSGASLGALTSQTRCQRRWNPLRNPNLAKTRVFLTMPI